MEDLDSALNELGMLSSCSKYRLDYLKVSKMIGCEGALALKSAVRY